MIGLIFIIFIVDRISKHYLLNTLPDQGGMIKIIPPFFNLTLVHNTGAAFGILAQNRIFLILFSLVGIFILFFFYLKEGKKNKKIKIPLCLILGGAAGNLFDRIYYGAVIDFFDFDFPDIIIPAKKIIGINFPGFFLIRWPAFNVADSCICVGIVLLFILLSFNPKEEKKNAPDSI